MKRMLISKAARPFYKALRSIRRFSEDIDLTVDVSDCPNPSQAKKRLEGAVLKFHGLGPCLEKDSRKGSVTCVYCYEPVTNLLPDALQRFGKVKVEGTSFTISKPHERLSIAPYLFEISSPSEKKALTEAYDVSPFELPTISLERIFLDKVFAAEFYFLRAIISMWRNMSTISPFSSMRRRFAVFSRIGSALVRFSPLKGRSPSRGKEE